MLNKTGFFLPLLAILIGLYFLYSPDLNQTTALIAGAGFIALGLVPMTSVTKHWLTHRRHQRWAAKRGRD